MASGWLLDVLNHEPTVPEALMFLKTPPRVHVGAPTAQHLRARAAVTPHAVRPSPLPPHLEALGSPVSGRAAVTTGDVLPGEAEPPAESSRPAGPGLQGWWRLSIRYKWWFVLLTLPDRQHQENHEENRAQPLHVWDSFKENQKKRTTKRTRESIRERTREGELGKENQGKENQRKRTRERELEKEN
ncbi:hypothetical protein EYF80_052274 [Liparis tanakae]|uniref:Uncharacterized protein n=1 Tax=Liparis tanakae TaxID=230148 RepID=A0A4Z2F9M8_9TELE|nr:hypothetical protein EYF80_052274 [Liparis tanakae]